MSATTDDVCQPANVLSIASGPLCGVNIVLFLLYELFFCTCLVADMGPGV